MFYNLNKHFVLQLVLSVLLFAWAAVTICTQLTLYPPQGELFLYQELYNALVNRENLAKGVALVVLLLDLIFIQSFFRINKFSENKTIIPIFFFLLCMNVGHFFRTLYPAHFTVLLLAFLNYFNTHDSSVKPTKNRMYMSGILVGIFSFIDPNALWIILFLILAIYSGRFNAGKEILILFAGLFTSYIYFFAYFFLTDSLQILWEYIEQLSFFGPIRMADAVPVWVWICAGMLILSMLWIVVTLKLYYDNKLIVLRRRYASTVVLWIVMIFAVLFYSGNLSEALIYQMLPITLFYSMLCNIRSRMILHDILIIAFLVLLWL